jgi:hypothetical protein
MLTCRDTPLPVRMACFTSQAKHNETSTRATENLNGKCRPIVRIRLHPKADLRKRRTPTRLTGDFRP